MTLNFTITLEVNWYKTCLPNDLVKDSVFGYPFFSRSVCGDYEVLIIIIFQSLKGGKIMQVMCIFSFNYFLEITWEKSTKRILLWVQVLLKLAETRFFDLLLWMYLLFWSMMATFYLFPFLLKCTPFLVIFFWDYIGQLRSLYNWSPIIKIKVKVNQHRKSGASSLIARIIPYS